MTNTTKNTSAAPQAVIPQSVTRNGITIPIVKHTARKRGDGEASECYKLEFAKIPLGDIITFVGDKGEEWIVDAIDTLHSKAMVSAQVTTPANNPKGAIVYTDAEKAAICEERARTLGQEVVAKASAKAMLKSLLIEQKKFMATFDGKPASVEKLTDLVKRIAELTAESNG